MIKVKPIKKVKSDHKIKNTCVSNSMKVFFIILHITFGLDFGFIKYKKTQHILIVKLLIAAYVIFVNYQSFILLSDESGTFDSINLWYLKYPIENIIYILILTFIPQHKSFSKFIQNLESIDSKLGVYPSRYFSFKIIIWCLICLTFKFILVISYCLKSEDCIVILWSHTLSFIPFLSMDVPFIVIFFTFGMVHCRLIAIRKCIQNKKLEALELQRTYKSLVDFTETVKKSFEPMIIITLLFNVPSVMVLIYLILKCVKLDMVTSDLLVMHSISIVSLVIVIFAPSIAASSLPTEVQTIRITLHDSMLEENDQNKLQGIQRFINYAETRSFKFYVFKIIPLDATLPIIIFNLCITYLIVVLQLTHLY